MKIANRISAVGRTRVVVVIALIAFVACGAVRAEDFVRRSGTHFMLGTQRFYYLGTSCYYLGHYAQDTSMGPGSLTWREMADQVLDRASDLGMRVIRVWAFNENDDAWSLQTSPGVYREQALAGFDYLLHRARELDIRLILTLVNNWDDFGGMNWYVGHSPGATDHDDFYTDPNCRQWFKNHLLHMATRTNTYSGLVYRDDPTIFAWELANEPRCKSDTSGVTLRDWIHDMAAYAKSVDTNHMVAVGEEGWTADEDWEGARWIPNNLSPNVDYCTIHCWPDHWTWMWGTSEPGLHDTAMEWVRGHLEAANSTLGKPMVLGEYGKARPTDGDFGRDHYYQGWFDVMYTDSSTDGASGGLNFWMFEADDSGHDDGFSVFYADTSTVSLIESQAYAINTLIAPTITAISREPQGIRLAWSEVVGSPDYRILLSDDLQSWRDGDLVSTNTWTDPATNHPAARFYRVTPRY